MATFNKCRVCICLLDATVGSYDMLQLPLLAHKFITCTDLCVQAEEQVPSELCQACYEQLEQLYEFRAKCIAADGKWHMEVLAHCVDEQATYDLEMVNCSNQMVELETEKIIEKTDKKRMERKQELYTKTEIEILEAEPAELIYEDEEQDLYTDQVVKSDNIIKKTDKKQMERKPKYEMQQTAYTKTEIEMLEAETAEIEMLETEPVEIEAEPAERINEEVDEEDLDTDHSSTQQQPKNVHKCDICAAQFLDEQRLVTHKRRHGQMPHPCTEPGCDRGYSHKHTLTLHMRKCHNLGKEHKSHVCEYCGKVFDTMSQLRNHRFTHKEKSELPHACEQPNCERRFSSKQLLKVHMMRHAGIKNYTCSHCGVQKTTRTELKIHLNYHTLERTYICRFCSKVCYSSSNLNKHMRTVHERARNYTCSYCERSFTQPAVCKQHELIHTGEKPHACKECGRHFRQKAALRMHNKIHKRQRKESDSSNGNDAVDSVADEQVCDVPEIEEIEYELS